MESARVSKSASPPLYREIADEVLRLIERGTLRPGQRIPSVRGHSRQKDVSITTVLEAYRVLEDEGFIEARPQSGYFVKPRLLRAPEEPSVSRPPLNPRSVGTRELMTMILRDAQRPGFAQLGAALPPRDLLPTEKLNRSLARAARRHSTRIFEPTIGAPELLTQIARRALDTGCSLGPREVMTTNGCQ